MPAARTLAVLVILLPFARSVAAQPAAGAPVHVETRSNRGPFVELSLGHAAFTSETLDSRTSSPLIAAGYQLTPHFSLACETTIGAREVERVRTARFALLIPDPAVQAAVNGLTRSALEALWPENDERITRRVRHATSVLATFHSRAVRRLRLGFVAGVTFQAESSRIVNDYPVLLDLTPRYGVSLQTEEHDVLQVLPSAGFEGDVRVHDRLSLVMRARFELGKDANDPDDWVRVLRPSIGARWRF
jgi:hypothetical protein